MADISTVEIDLQPFCETDKETRYQCILKPWNAGGLRIATDSRMLVVVPTSEPDTKFSEGDRPAPDVTDIYADGLATVCDKPWPETFSKCPTCGQSGLVNKYFCSRCDGIGFHTCNLGHDHDCRTCRGKGYTDHGSPENAIAHECEDDFCPVFLDGSKFNRSRLQRFAKLPQPILYGMKEDRIVVKTGDVVGILMCIHRD